jgi:hypothetical protein
MKMRRSGPFAAAGPWVDEQQEHFYSPRIRNPSQPPHITNDTDANFKPQQQKMDHKDEQQQMDVG